MCFSEGVRVNGIGAGKPKIYVVDDEQVIASTLCLILQRVGYDASMFFSAETALAAIHSAAPDLVLSDITMTGAMNGVDLAELLAQTHPLTKVLLVSGMGNSSYSLRNAKARGFVPEVRMKPISPPLLLAEIAGLLAKPASRSSHRSLPLYDPGCAAAATLQGVIPQCAVAGHAVHVAPLAMAAIPCTAL